MLITGAVTYMFTFTIILNIVINVLLSLAEYNGSTKDHVLYFTVLTAPHQGCESPHILSSHDSHGFISSYVAKNTGCGNIDHPWRVEVQPGQRVNLTLTSFHIAVPKSHKRCRPLGYEFVFFISMICTCITCGPKK